MSRICRRSALVGFAGTAGIAALSRMPGTHTVSAQGSGYDIVSFGPISEGVIPADGSRTRYGTVFNILGGGTAVGSVPASAEKMYPSLFHPDGSLTKLKSGAFGGIVLDMNDNGTAVGGVAENAGGVRTESDEGNRPAAWIDGELVRLELPEGHLFESALTGGQAGAISNDGVIFGFANGYQLVWIDGIPQELPQLSDAGDSLFYSLITRDGTLMASRAMFDDSGSYLGSEYGSVDGATFTPFATSGLSGINTYIHSANSAGEVLIYSFPTDLTISNIVGVGQDPIVIDTRHDGIEFMPAGFNASHEVAGMMYLRPDLEGEPAIWKDGEVTSLSPLLPADHGYRQLVLSGISDDGVVAASGWDDDGAFHPLLFVPA